MRVNLQLQGWLFWKMEVIKKRFSLWSIYDFFNISFKLCFSQVYLKRSTTMMIRYSFPLKKQCWAKFIYVLHQIVTWKKPKLTVTPTMKCQNMTSINICRLTIRRLTLRVKTNWMKKTNMCQQLRSMSTRTVPNRRWIWERL